MSSHLKAIEVQCTVLIRQVKEHSEQLNESQNVSVCVFKIK